jgi:hypothetical protein
MISGQSKAKQQRWRLGAAGKRLRELEVVAIAIVILGCIEALCILEGLLLRSFILFVLHVFIEGEGTNTTSKGADGKASGKAAIAALLGRLLLVVVGGRRGWGLAIAIAGG